MQARVCVLARNVNTTAFVKDSPVFFFRVRTLSARSREKEKCDVQMGGGGGGDDAKNVHEWFCISARVLAYVESSGNPWARLCVHIICVNDFIKACISDLVLLLLVIQYW